MNEVIYISGPITGKEDYLVAFDQARQELSAAGYIPLSPAILPPGMSYAQYMRINFAMIDAADAVLLLDGWEMSRGASLECSYCSYIRKPFTCYIHELEALFKRMGHV